MKISIVSGSPDQVRSLLSEHGNFFEVDDKNPEMVISHGGDGTFMKAEHLYPGVPKLFLKNSRVAKLAHHSKENSDVLKNIVTGDYSIEDKIKLEAVVNGKVFVALNDIVLHNENPRYGVRYSVEVNGFVMREEIIGDGIVFATPLGSTGYYRSITDSFFEIGIGVAFNNSTEQSDHMVLEESRTIRVRIIRGPAICYADNQEQSVKLMEGDFVEVKKSKQIAKIVLVI